MRARRKYKKLGRTSAHRLSMLSNLVMSLYEHESLQTTIDRAKEASRLADKLVTLGRKGQVHHRRLAAKVLWRKEIVSKLFDDISKRNLERPSGHTRIIRLPARRGDAASMVIWQLVDRPTPKTEVVDATPKEESVQKSPEKDTEVVEVSSSDE
ncbi:50S ribosomal protein L17 [PVC group bacterium (ex Bugula neritina AB1)]|nr:50S ribosomal protein L17 [PVC group bacterium (ex Bugula neritina AB1)]